MESQKERGARKPYRGFALPGNLNGLKAGGRQHAEVEYTPAGHIRHLQPVAILNLDAEHNLGSVSIVVEVLHLLERNNSSGSGAVPSGDLGIALHMSAIHRESGIPRTTHILGLCRNHPITSLPPEI